jgi:hypothetical protein
MLMQSEAAAGTLTSVSQGASGGVSHVLCLVGIIIIAGALGGLINYFQSVESGTEQPKNSRGASAAPSMRRRIVIGMGAAFLVPLFLNMISSDLLLACRETPTKLLVFAGFCLVAAISSSAFIKSLSDRLIEQATQKAEEANQRVDEVKRDLEPIKAKATEPQGVGAQADRHDSPRYAMPSLTLPQRKVLRALCETGFAFRSVEGISESTGIEPIELRAILNGLAEGGLVRQTPTEDGVRWCLTKQGREVNTSAQTGPDAEVIRLRQSEGVQTTASGAANPGLKRTDTALSRGPAA